jgi:hypothetical protein
MTVRLIDRADAPAPTTSPPARPACVPDPGYDAVSWFTHLRDRLAAAIPTRTHRAWKEPPVFFFDRRRQAELDATRPAPPADADPYAEVSAHIRAELPGLFASVEVRRVARAVDGLRRAAEALAPVCPAAKDLTDLLAVPDDEVFLVLDPARRVGFRLAARGLVDVGQFHLLLGDAVAGGVPERFVAACRDANAAVPAGVPMVAEARFQLYAPAALRADASLPTTFGGCEHWLWPTAPLAAVPRIDGERVVLLGPPAYLATWDVSRRFPAMPAELRVVEALSPFRVAERLSRLTGNPVTPVVPREAAEVLSKAA